MGREETYRTTLGWGELHGLQMRLLTGEAIHRQAVLDVQKRKWHESHIRMTLKSCTTSEVSSEHVGVITVVSLSVGSTKATTHTWAADTQWIIYRRYNKGLRSLSGCSSHLNEQNYPVNIRPETSACWVMGDIFATSTAAALCGSHAFQHIFQLFAAQKCALCRKFMVSLESSDRHSLLVAAIPLSHCSALNTPRFLGDPTATNAEH
jgi:hypothetical protein